MDCRSESPMSTRAPDPSPEESPEAHAEHRQGDAFECEGCGVRLDEDEDEVCSNCTVVTDRPSWSPHRCGNPACDDDLCTEREIARGVCDRCEGLQ